MIYFEFFTNFEKYFFPILSINTGFGCRIRVWMTDTGMDTDKGTGMGTGTGKGAGTTYCAHMVRVGVRTRALHTFL